MSSLKSTIESQVSELTKRLEKLKESLEKLGSLKLYEVGIKKSTGQVYLFKYGVEIDGCITVTVISIPEYSNTPSIYSISLDTWLTEFIEYSPSKRQLFPKG